MITHFFKSFICVAVISNRSIVRAENDHGIFFQSLFFQIFHDFSHTPVELNDHIPTITHRRCATESFMGNSRYMQIMGSKEEEEWILLIFPYPFF